MKSSSFSRSGSTPNGSLPPLVYRRSKRGFYERGASHQPRTNREPSKPRVTIVGQRCDTEEQDRSVADGLQPSAVAW